MKILDKFSKLLFQTCENFQEENKLTVHKILIEDNSLKFEIWSAGKNGEIQIKTYSYSKSPKKKNKK